MLSRVSTTLGNPKTYWRMNPAAIVAGKKGRSINEWTGQNWGVGGGVSRKANSARKRASFVCFSSTTPNLPSARLGHNCCGRLKLAAWQPRGRALKGATALGLALQTVLPSELCSSASSRGQEPRIRALGWGEEPSRPKRGRSGFKERVHLGEGGEVGEFFLRQAVASRALVALSARRASKETFGQSALLSLLAATRPGELLISAPPLQIQPPFPPGV